ncbi:MAG: hypothetical protein U1E65_35005 [Myxococcota bacterium]
MRDARLAWICLALFGCGTKAAPVDDGITHRSEVNPVTEVSQALPGVVIPPFLDCRAPLAGQSTSDPSGKVCTQVSIAGATEPGKSFADYASCDVVRTQRPYYPRPPAKVPAADDARLSDAAFMGELAWAKQEIAATGCACCHDSARAPRGASQWDISAGPVWLDTLSDSGLALFTGLADSSVLGAYPAAANHGFDRTATGIPTTDTARMRSFMIAELGRRGISEADARAIPPFGGPIYQNFIRSPGPCGPGIGVDPSGKVQFGSLGARYLYVLAAGSKNPGVPPNLDRPAGTLWRLDVLPSLEPVQSGLQYGTTPAGSFQDTPEEGAAPALVPGQTYQLTALLDVGLPAENCLFVYGEPLLGPVDAGVSLAEDAGATDAGGADAGTSMSGDAGSSFGIACTDDAGCGGATSYCAKQPGASEGYCTATGCTSAPAVCPTGWSCFDLSVFQPGAPSICRRP